MFFQRKLRFVLSYLFIATVLMGSLPAFAFLFCFFFSTFSVKGLCTATKVEDRHVHSNNWSRVTKANKFIAVQIQKCNTG